MTSSPKAHKSSYNTAENTAVPAADYGGAEVHLYQSPAWVQVPDGWPTSSDTTGEKYHTMQFDSTSAVGNQ